MTTHPANAAFHTINNAVQAIQATVRAPEPTEAELLEELEYQLSDALYQLEIANRRSDGWRWQTERDRALRRISNIEAQIKIVNGASL